MHVETNDPLKGRIATGDKTGTAALAALPGEDTPYQAAGMANTHECNLLVVILGKDGFRPGHIPYHGFEYPHIGNLKFGFTEAGYLFRFIYSGPEPEEVILHGEGDGVLRIWHQIGERQIPWIRMAERDFRPAGAAADAPIFTSISVRPWKPGPTAEAEKPARGKAPVRAALEEA